MRRLSDEARAGKHGRALLLLADRPAGAQSEGDAMIVCGCERVPALLCCFITSREHRPVVRRAGQLAGGREEERERVASGVSVVQSIREPRSAVCSQSPVLGCVCVRAPAASFTRRSASGCACMRIAQPTTTMDRRSRRGSRSGSAAGGEHAAAAEAQTTQPPPQAPVPTQQPTQPQPQPTMQWQQQQPPVQQWPQQQTQPPPSPQWQQQTQQQQQWGSPTLPQQPWQQQQPWGQPQWAQSMPQQQQQQSPVPPVVQPMWTPPSPRMQPQSLQQPQPSYGSQGGGTGSMPPSPRFVSAPPSPASAASVTIHLGGAAPGTPTHATAAVSSPTAAASPPAPNASAASPSASPASPQAPAGATPVPQWSVADVRAFLDQLGLGTLYGDRFAESLINGESLLELNDSDLIELGIQDKFHRRKLLKKIRAIDPLTAEDAALEASVSTRSNSFSMQQSPQNDVASTEWVPAAVEGGQAASTGDKPLESNAVASPSAVAFTSDASSSSEQAAGQTPVSPQTQQKQEQLPQSPSAGETSYGSSGNSSLPASPQPVTIHTSPSAGPGTDSATSVASPTSPAGAVQPSSPDFVLYEHPPQQYAELGLVIPELEGPLAGNIAAPIVITAQPRGYTSVPALSERANKLRARAEQTAQPVSVSASVDLSHRNGRPGVHGADGSRGSDGMGGYSGSTGSRGGNGSSGMAGADGQRGGDATGGLHASGQDLILRGNPQILQLQNGHSVSNLNLGDRGILFVDARGGDGAAGGNGGDGGSGGAGGHGGSGGNGYRGSDAYSTGASGGNGGPGGDGGDGGDGGRGGNGAAGGNAGAGGNGAPVAISVTQADLPLLVLAEADVIGGASAKGGHAGSGGSGGQGGAGGAGGTGGSGGSGGPAETDSQGHLTSFGGMPGSRGSDGRVGSNGSQGSRGSDSFPGHDAPRGTDGSVQYRIIDSSGKILASSLDRFNAAVLSYEIVDDNEDGIFEPGSTFLIRNVTIVNNGGLPLPAGCALQWPNTATAHWIDCEPHILPAIAVGGSWTVLAAVRTFRFQIPHLLAPSAGKPFRSTTTTIASVRCLDRSFLESEVSTGPVPVQYPIQIAAVQATTYLAPGESTTVVIRVNNISSRGYGTDRMGRVEVRLRLHPLMIVLPSPDGSYALTADGAAVREFFCIPPGTEVSVCVQVQMSAESGANLFESLQWMADLYLRSRCVEFRSAMIRVTPLFQPATFSDVVLVTCPAIDRKEFLCWSYLLQLAGLSVNFWDLERYKTLSHDDFTWVGSCKHLFFPVHDDQLAPLSVLTFADVVLHFQSSPDASILVWGSRLRALDPVTYDFTRPSCGTLKHPRHIARPEYIKTLPRPRVPAAAAPEQEEMKINDEEAVGLYQIYLDDLTDAEQKKKGFDPWIAFSCCCAGEADALKAAESTRQKAMKEDGFRQFVSAVHVDVEPNPEGSCLRTSWKMGELGIYRAILPLSAKLAVHTSFREQLSTSNVPFAYDGVNFRALETPLSGRFGEAMAAILSILPIRTLMAHKMDRSYLSSRMFQVRTGTNEMQTYSFPEVLTAILHHRLSQEFEMKHENAPISAELLQAVNELHLHSKANVTNEAALANSVAFVSAFKRLHKERFWSAFPWCCTQNSRHRSALADTVEGYLAHADDVMRSKILNAVDLAIADRSRPFLTLNVLLPDVAWPMHKRLKDKKEKEPVMQREEQQAYAAAQLWSWNQVSQKQVMWSLRAEAAMAAAQAQGGDQRALDAANALAMAAWQAQMAYQANVPVGKPEVNFREAIVPPHRTEYKETPGEIAHPELTMPASANSKAASEDGSAAHNSSAPAAAAAAAGSSEGGVGASLKALGSALGDAYTAAGGMEGIKSMFS